MENGTGLSLTLNPSAARSHVQGFEEGVAAAEVFASGLGEDAQDLGGFHGVEGAAAEFEFAGVDALGQADEVGLDIEAGRVLAVFPFDGAFVVELLGMAFVPVAQGGDGDFELLGNGEEGVAQGAEFEEALDGVGGVFHRLTVLKIEELVWPTRVQLGEREEPVCPSP